MNIESEQITSLARQSIAHYLEFHEYLKVPGDLPEDLYLPLGCFVTYKSKNNHELKGCIGLIQAETPLIENLIQFSVHAAINDPRFPSITLEDLPELSIEVSVMGPICDLGNIEDIEVGRHGLIVNRGSNQGLLLPQVATEYNMNRETFLEHTCMKAGLPKDSYLEAETKLFYFTADIFSENN
jgi:uncharacterized protein